MPPKPRPHGKPKHPGPPKSGTDRRLLVIAAAAGVAVVVIAGVALALANGGDDGPGDARPALEAAGCTLETKPALKGVHSITTPDGTSDEWNTDPPTSGAHYEVPVIWGTYTEPVNQAQLVHNLEHGGVAIQWGSKVPAEDVEKIRSWYQDDPDGIVLAPLPALGDKISLVAWQDTTPGVGDKGLGRVAKCTAFDKGAFDAFLEAYGFQGPEAFPRDSLQPGGN